MQIAEGVEVRLVELVVRQRRVQPLVRVVEREANSGSIAKKNKCFTKCQNYLSSNLVSLTRLNEINNK